MAIFYFAIVLLVLYQIRFCRVGYYKYYLEKGQSSAIKGIFILIVFLRHIYPYIVSSGYAMNGILDRFFLIIDMHIGQLLVALFLFYSGYGVTESIKKKGKPYIHSFPKRRLLTTILNFDIAVLFFLFTNILLGNKMSCNNIILSFLCWESIGNSNWYIFVILLCYLFTYVSYLINSRHFLAISIIISIIAVLILFYFKPSYWYDTLLCYSAGMYWSAYKERIDI